MLNNKLIKLKSIVFIVTVCTVILITGCASSSDPAASKYAITDIRPALLATAESVENSLSVLAAAQQTDNPPVINIEPLITPEGGMGMNTDIDWSGPLAPLLQKIAEKSGYRLKIIGNHPAIPVVVTITKNNVLLADILKDASYQAVKRATVIAYPENKVIELRYATVA